jgi:two-component system KDP operon response regulator KdpE
MTTVVVADPDERSRRLVTAALRHGGYAVALAHDDKHILSLLGRRFVGAIVLDPTLGDGAESVNDLRLRTDVPIIVVSELREEHDKVTMLDAGADDYLCKPIAVEEFLARLRSALRRTTPRDIHEEAVVTPDFTIHLSDRRLLRTDGTVVRLTPTEWRLLDVLTEHAGHLVSQSHLLERVWGPSAMTKTAYLRVHMASIRRKVEPQPSRPRYFITAPGLGIRFQPAATRDTSSPSRPVTRHSSPSCR